MAVEHIIFIMNGRFKKWKDIDIHYIGYVAKNKAKDWCVNSVNPLYLIINKVFSSVGEENGIILFEN